MRPSCKRQRTGQGAEAPGTEGGQPHPVESGSRWNRAHTITQMNTHENQRLLGVLGVTVGYKEYVLEGPMSTAPNASQTLTRTTQHRL